MLTLDYTGLKFKRQELQQLLAEKNIIISQIGGTGSIGTIHLILQADIKQMEDRLSWYYTPW